MKQMKWSRNAALAVFLIACGVMILLSRFGIEFDNVFEWLFPIIMVGLGYYGIRHGRSTMGWIVMTLGLIFLAGQMWGIIAFLVPIALIWFGWTMLRRRKAYE
jgi:lia operon protein LiaI